MTNRIDSAMHDHGFDPPAINPQTFNSPWANEALTQRVYALWPDHSSTQIRGVIGKEFGVHLTRNQIVGKVARAGLTSEHKTELEPRTVRAKRTTIPSRPKTHRPKLRIVSNGAGTGLRVMQSFETDQFEAREAPVEPRNLTLLELEPHDCRYVVCDQQWLFCGQAVQEKSSYCPGHHALVWVKPQPRKIGGWR